MKTTDDEARRNRELMPETARTIDAFRAFDPRCRVVHAQEGAQERGQPSPPARAMNADQWLRYVKTGELP